MRETDEARWNANIHYHRVVLDAVPPGCRDALDVGCGEGMLARQLRRRVPRVTAIDIDGPSIEAARRQDPHGEIRYLHGDFLTHRFPPASFDLVTCVAALHHLAAVPALERMAGLLRPGGRLAVVGLARHELTDLPLALVSTVARRAYRIGRRYWVQTAPTVWPPPESFRSMRRVAGRCLPGVRYRRHLLGRYSLVWQK